MDSLNRIRTLIEGTAKSYWTEPNVFYGIIGFSWILFSWGIYLSFRQYRVIQTTQKVPEELKTVLDDETFNKARAYNIDKAKFSFVSRLFNEIQGTLILIYLLMPILWEKSGLLCARFGLKGGAGDMLSEEIYQSIMFMLVCSLLSTLVELPFSLYNTFVLEERHGFNKQTFRFYCKDKLKQLLVSFAISMPVIAVVIAIVRLGGPYFFFYLWLFVTFVMLILMTFHAEIAAIFDNYTSLPEGELRSQIEALASSVNFPLCEIFVVEGSARSSHSNAYFFGFFNRKRIVLYDTLIKGYSDAKKDQQEATSDKEISAKKDQGCENDEILAVLGHELGHWYLNHVAKNIVFAQVNLFFMFLMFSQLYQNATLFSAFGFHSERPVIIGLVLVMMYVFAPYNELTGFISICLSRRYEFQADLFAKNMGKSEQLCSSLVKLNKDNLGFPVYDNLYSKYNHSHPPLLERIRVLKTKQD